MPKAVAVSAESHRRIRRASAWLGNRSAAAEVLVVGASLDAANELTRNATIHVGAAFGWHRLTLSQLALSIVRPELADRGLVPVERIVADAIVARFLHNLKTSNSLGRFQPIAETPGFPRSIARVITELRSADVASKTISADPMQRGSLIHDVQFQLFAQLRQNDLIPVRPANLEKAGQALERIVAEVAASYHDDLGPAIERVWEDGIAVIRADLREWLRRLSEDESGYVPVHFELTFGIERPDWNRVDPQSVGGAINLESGIQLRGSIDLVERHPTGIVRITDHKTGRPDNVSDLLIDGGKVLQPLFYALVAEKLLAGQAKVRSGRLYFCTSVGGFVEQVVNLSDEARAAAVQVVEIIDAAVAAPFLPAAPDKRECEYCNYRSVCGPYEELRVSRKPRQRLEPLFALRESR